MLDSEQAGASFFRLRAAPAEEMLLSWEALSGRMAGENCPPGSAVEPLPPWKTEKMGPKGMRLRCLRLVAARRVGRLRRPFVAGARRDDDDEHQHHCCHDRGGQGKRARLPPRRRSGRAFDSGRAFAAGMLVGKWRCAARMIVLQRRRNAETQVWPRR